MHRRPSEFTFKFGMHMAGISRAAHRFEGLIEFKQFVIDELENTFGCAALRERFDCPLEHGLVCDPNTGFVDDGDLRNWINLTFEDLGVPVRATSKEDSACFYDRKGCWWKVRSFLMEQRDEDGEWAPFTARKAARRFADQQNDRAADCSCPVSPLQSRISATTEEELGDVPYRMTVERKECPEEEDDRGGNDDPKI